MMRILIDAGHGPGEANGKSSAWGARGPSGTREADIMMRLARELAARLGSSAMLTRSADENPSLSTRAERARRANADVLVSLHADHTRCGARGGNVWIHDRALESSRALARELGRALVGSGTPMGEPLSGPLALLSPELHQRHTAACLVEVGDLAHPDAERRLRSERAIADLANALAVGIRSFAGGTRSARYGAPAVLDRDSNGVLWLPDGQGIEVGLTDAAGLSHVGFNADNTDPHGAPLELAAVGFLDFGDGAQALALIDCERVTLRVSANPSPTTGLERQDVTYSGARSGRSWTDGDLVLDLNAREYIPVDPARMSAALQARLDPRARVELYKGGKLWIWMSFALANQTVETARWVLPGHTRSDIEAVRSDIDPEIELVPANTVVRAAVEAYRSIIIGVATHEGSFGAVSPPTDSMASLGIFQWGATKNATDTTSSLGMFFSALSDRAAEARRTATPDAEQQLYMDAWQQCTNRGLSVAGGQIQLGGSPATGAQVEGTMHAEMARGKLRTYQLIASVDWIENFRDTIVRPGVNGKRWVGNDYGERGRGQSATLSLRGTTLELDVSNSLTIGQIFTTTKELASAVILGVNRPHYVESAAWRTLAPADAKSQLGTLLADLLTELSAGVGGKRRYTDADVDATGALAVTIREQIRGIIWPLVLPPSNEQWRMVHDFRRHAMNLYAPADAVRFKREQRFSTLELLDW